MACGLHQAVTLPTTACAARAAGISGRGQHGGMGGPVLCWGNGQETERFYCEGTSSTSPQTLNQTTLDAK